MAGGWPLRTTLVAPWYIDTGMFAGVHSRIPWLLPILRPDDVCQRIVSAIDSDRRRLVMPAFGAYTGGLDTADPAITGLFPRGGRAFLLGGERLYSFPLLPRQREVAREVTSLGGGGQDLPLFASVKLRSG